MIAHELMSQDHCCCFCTDMARQDQQLVLSREGFFNKLCRRAQHFGAFPSLSPLTAGHCLVVPLYHVTSIAQVDSRYVDECLAFLDEIVDVIQGAFGPSVVFEHGVGHGKKGGCGVTHAHLHVLPMDVTSAKALRARIQERFDGTTTGGIEDLFEVPRERSYLLFGCLGEPFHLTTTDAAPSQYLRRLIAEVCRLDAWDWRGFYGWETFRATRRVLVSAVGRRDAVEEDEDGRAQRLSHATAE